MAWFKKKPKSTKEEFLKAKKEYLEKKRAAHAEIQSLKKELMTILAAKHIKPVQKTKRIKEIKKRIAQLTRA